MGGADLAVTVDRHDIIFLSDQQYFERLGKTDRPVTSYFPPLGKNTVGCITGAGYCSGNMAMHQFFPAATPGQVLLGRHLGL